VSPTITKIDVASLRSFASDTFAALGMPRADADVQADALVAADLRDMHTYGVACIPAYAECLTQGRINPRPNIKMERRGPWALACDGDNGMGHLVASRAMDAAILTAEKAGIGIVVVRHSNHFGAACIYPLMALKKNFIGIIMANSSPAVAPWGGREKLLGTNPVAVAVPTGRYPPFVADMAMASVGRLKIREAKRKGLSIPSEWAFDSQGKPTSDPSLALSGSLAPMGGPKGFALITLVDILAGVLSGAQFGGGVLSFLTNLDREADGGNLVIALDVKVFMPFTEFARRMDTLIDNIKAVPLAEGVKEIRISGERGAKSEAEQRQSGISLDSDTIVGLSELGEKLGVRFPTQD